VISHRTYRLIGLKDALLGRAFTSQIALSAEKQLTVIIGLTGALEGEAHLISES
jgi:hypothetical protein